MRVPPNNEKTSKNGSKMLILGLTMIVFVPIFKIGKFLTTKTNTGKKDFS